MIERWLAMNYFNCLCRGIKSLWMGTCEINAEGSPAMD